MYCDIPYAFFSNSSLLLLISELRLKDLRTFTLSAFLAGCSAFTKNEGLVFLGWYGLLAAASLGLEYQQSKKFFLKSFLAIASGLILPLSVCAYFKIELASGQANVLGISNPADIFAALMRLLLQTGALALVFVFETFGFRRHVKS